MIKAEEDPGKNMRKMAVEKFLYGVDGLAGKRICDHVVTAFFESDNPSPQKIQYQEDDSQIKSESFWIATDNTYLAPKDYYDKREEILEEALTVMPKINNIIDIGCGDGRFTRQLAKFANNIDAYDISSILIARAIDKASELLIDNVTFHTAELDEIKPFRKYSLVSCMGVTSCLIDDVKFIRILDCFIDLVISEGYLLMIDTLSTKTDQIATDDSGYIAKYRDIKSYCQLIERRGFSLIREVVIKDIPERDLVNKLFIFSKN